MTTIDFEKAIDALNCDIDVREMCIHHGNVTEVWGRKELTFLHWDNNGRAFSFVQNADSEDCITDETMKGLAYQRDTLYDLKFE